MRKILQIVVVLAIAVIAVPVAMADGHEVPAPVYCLDGQTVTLPVTMSVPQGSRTLTEGIANTAISTSNGYFFLGYVAQMSGVFFLFTDDEESAEEVFEPGYSGPHRVQAGACAPGAAPFVPPPPPMLPACYSRFQVDPAYYPFALAQSLYKLGYWRPYAVASPVSRTNLNNGYYLTCQLGSRTVKNGAAISSGIGGTPYDSTGTIAGATPATAAYVQYLLSDPHLMGGFLEIAG